MQKILFLLLAFYNLSAFAMQQSVRVYDPEQTAMLQSLLHVFTSKQGKPYGKIIDLILAGADPNVKASCGDYKGDSWLQQVMDTHDGNALSCAITLLHYGADPNFHLGLHRVCLFGWSDYAIMLIKYGANVRQRDPFGGFPLFSAVDGGYVVTKILLDEGAGADIHIPNRHGITPFTYAQHFKAESILKLFATYKE